MQNRKQEYDIAKGIAILLVVCGHVFIASTNLRTIILAFHLPTFFMITGMLLREKANGGETVRIKIKTVKKLLVPYFVFESLWVVLLVFRELSTVDTYLVLSSGLKKMFTVGNIGTWYLTCLLLSETIFVFMVKNRYGKVISEVLMIISLIITWQMTINKYFIIFLLRVLIGQGFITIGYYGYSILKKTWSKRFIELFIVVLVFSAVYNKEVDLYCLKTNMPLLYVFNAVLGFTIIINISTRIIHTKIAYVLSYFGKNSIIVLTLNQFIITILNSILKFPNVEILVLILTLFSLVLGIIIINRYFQFLYCVNNKHEA